MLKSRITYANVTATLALVFSMSGGAFAAHHYLVSSTKQISPKVIKALKGKAGPAGKVGATGKEGTAGKEGKEGPAGSAVAYAHVLGLTDAAAPLDTGNSKNISFVKTVSPGAYCVGTSVPIKNVAGTPDFKHGGVVGETVTADFDEVAKVIETKVCPAGTTVLIETGITAKLEAINFWLTFE